VETRYRGRQDHSGVVFNGERQSALTFLVVDAVTTVDLHQKAVAIVVAGS
jgi:hypothetical protein